MDQCGMDLQLLGPIEASVDGRRIRLGATKQRAVLAMLALPPNRTVSVDRLIEGLWGEEAPDSAAKMVQLYVSQLRKLLDGNGAEIVTHGRGYELRLPLTAVDVGRFEQSERRWCCRVRRSRCGAVTRWPTSRGSRSRRRRSGGWRSCGGREGERDRRRPRRRPPRARCSRSSRRWSRRIRCRSGCTRSGCSRCIARVARPMRWRRTAPRVKCSSSRSASSPVPSFAASTKRCSSRTRSSTSPPSRPRPPCVPLAAPPRRVLAVVGALLVVCGLAVFAVTRLTESDGLARIDENAVGVIDPDSGRITEQSTVGRGPSAIAAGGGSVWVANRLDGTVTRLGGERDAKIIPVGDRPTALAFAAGSLWVVDAEERSVARVDPATNRVEDRIEAGNAPSGVAAGFGALWVTSEVDRTLARIDLRTAARTEIDLGANPTAVATGADAVWVTSEEGGVVFRIEPRLAGGDRHDRCRQRPGRRRRRRGRRLGRQPPGRERLTASTRRRTRSRTSCRSPETRARSRSAPAGCG